MSSKKAIISVTNDLVTDNRVHKIALTLQAVGYDVVLVGRQLSDFNFLDRPYKTKRFKLWFKKGALFYANYNLRLFFYLLSSKANLYWSNDLDTLIANYFASKFTKAKLIYDCHEYFTEVPELVNRPTIKKVWCTIEKMIMPKLKTVFTVSSSIADVYSNKYNINVKVLRNVPLLNEQVENIDNLQLNDNKMLIYQGAINLGRGIELLIKAMQYVNDAELYIFGEGDIGSLIKTLIKDLKLQDKVHYKGRVPLEKLRFYTQQADLGFSLERNLGLNYRYALPNKVFDYIHAHVPVLVSNLIEMKRLVEEYSVGEVTNAKNEKELANKINLMLANKEQLKIYKQNTEKAIKVLNWQLEQQIIYKSI